MDSTSLSPERSLWRSLDFRLLLAGRLVSQFGDQLQFLALPLLVLSLSGSATKAGAILGLQTAAHLGFGLVAGALVDRWNRRTTMISCEVSRAVLVASVPLALLAGALTMPQLYLVAALSGVATTLFNAANSSALPNVVPPAQLPEALGTLSAASSALRIVGAPLAGVAYALSRALPFGINAVSFLLSALTLHRVRAEFQESRQQAHGSAREVLGEIAEGLSWLWRKSVIRTLALIDAGDSLRFGAGYLLIVVLATRLHATPIQIGLVFAGAAAGGLLGGLAAARLSRRFPLGRLAIIMLWVEATTFPCYALAPTWWLLLVVAFAESVVAPIYSVTLDSYRLRVTPDALRGRVSSAVDTLTTGGSAIGAVVGGALIGLVGPDLLTVALTGLLALLAVGASTSHTVRTAGARTG